MNQTLLVDQLLKYNLTRQEANIYLTLLIHQDVTGYEIAKITGISRSNVYNALAGLVEKGAAYIIEGTVTKYVAVPLEEFCDNQIRDLYQAKDFLLENQPKDSVESDGYITIEGHQHILNKIKNMIKKCEYRVYLSLDKKLLKELEEEINFVVARELKVVILTNEPVNIQGVFQYQNQKEYQEQFQIITDSKYVLTGEIGGSALYSGQKNFVKVFKDSLANEIKLLELTKGEQAYE